MSQKIGDHISLFAGVHNILDEGEVELLPVRPRTFWGTRGLSDLGQQASPNRPLTKIMKEIRQ